jgi:hypothetical protein
VRDAEVAFRARPLAFALLAAIAFAISACQHQLGANEIARPTPSPTASPRPWQSDETTLDIAGRAIIAQVRAKIPPALRRCIVWTRLPPSVKTVGLPDRNLIVMFHFAHEEAPPGRPGYYILYLDGAVHIDSNVVYIPNWDEPIIATMMTFNPNGIPKDTGANCLT